MTATKERIIFVRRLTSPTHTFAIVLTAIVAPVVFTPKDFLAFSREARVKFNIDPNRQRVLAHEEVLSDLRGATCAKFHLKTEDFGALEKGSAPFLIIDDHGYSCLHPDQASLVIHITSSQRGKSSEMDPSWGRMGEEFIQNFRFTPMKASPKE